MSNLERFLMGAALCPAPHEQGLVKEGRNRVSYLERY